MSIQLALMIEAGLDWLSENENADPQFTYLLPDFGYLHMEAILAPDNVAATSLSEALIAVAGERCLRSDYDDAIAQILTMGGQDAIWIGRSTDAQ